MSVSDVQSVEFPTVVLLARPIPMRPQPLTTTLLLANSTTILLSVAVQLAASWPTAFLPTLARKF